MRSRWRCRNFAGRVTIVFKERVAKKLKNIAIHAIDMLDSGVLRPAYMQLRYKVADSTWWGTEKCSCEWCNRFKSDLKDEDADEQ